MIEDGSSTGSVGGVSVDVDGVGVAGDGGVSKCAGFNLSMETVSGLSAF